MADQALLLQALRLFAGAMKRSYDVTEMCYELCDGTVDGHDGWRLLCWGFLG